MSEWEKRLLCPDGACVGVIGDDGICKLCGRVAPNWGEERRRGLLVDGAVSGADPVPESEHSDEDGANDDHEGDGDDYEGDEDGEDGDDSDDGDADDGEAPSSDDASPPIAGAASEWDGRKLCPDGACVGLIGDGGTCNVCGRSGSS